MTMLDELRHLHEAATPPPWFVDGIGDVRGGYPTDECPALVAETHYVDDGPLIAAARNALPALLALADAARAWRDAVQRIDGVAAAEVALLAAVGALEEA